jgi:2-succinyl-5-enolpyruvyl-6-hydroxy-3-cyclohexene-1-carboxylate synthase
MVLLSPVLSWKGIGRRTKMEDQKNKWFRDWLENSRQDQRRRAFDEFLARSRQRDRQVQDWVRKVQQDRQEQIRKSQQDFLERGRKLQQQRLDQVRKQLQQERLHRVRMMRNFGSSLGPPTIPPLPPWKRRK